MMKLLIVLSLVCAAMYGQSTAGPYIAFDDVTLSSAAETLTVQQILHGTTDLQIKSGSMWCSVSTIFRLSINGTAASGTTLTPLSLNIWSAAAKATAWKASNVGLGTTVKTYNFTGGASELGISLADIKILRSAGTTGNISISTGTLTGNCKLSFTWSEGR